MFKSALHYILISLNSINNTGLRLTVGAFRSSSIISIYNIAGEPIPVIKMIEISSNLT